MTNDDDYDFSYGTYESDWATFYAMCGGKSKPVSAPERELRNGWIGNVPVIHKSTYKNPRGVIYNSDICLMRGSKLAIASYCYDDRVFEYDYFFARWLGMRFAKRVNYNKKRVVRIRSSKQRINGGHQVEKCFLSEFSNGFYQEIEDKSLEARLCQRGIYSQKPPNRRLCSDVYLICSEKEGFAPAYNLVDELYEVDLFEREVGITHS